VSGVPRMSRSLHTVSYSFCCLSRSVSASLMMTFSLLTWVRLTLRVGVRLRLTLDLP